MDARARLRMLAARKGHAWRARRYGRFAVLCGLRSKDRIIDIGSGAGGALAVFNHENEITAVDLHQWPSDAGNANVRFVQGNGCALPFPDRSFDIAFSNSVIEHMCARDQQRFAAELRRVADRYYVQTPNRFFPLEPHYQLPLFRFLPLAVQRFLVARFQLGWQQKGEMETIRLLSARQLQQLFPDATIHRERLLGLTKSLMAVRNA
jgi:SAM-dependent methyltransferase